MAQQKKTKKKSWQCKLCAEPCGSMSALKAHYNKYPDHNPNPRSTSSKKAALSVNFCPNCGCPVEMISQALQLATKIK